MLFTALRNKCLNIFQTVRNLSKASNNAFICEKLTGNREGILTIGFNRPEAKNALKRANFVSLGHMFSELKFDRNIRVIILHSLVQGVFCSGADLPEAEIGPFTDQFCQTVAKIAEVPIPTIAAIDGYALGGGLEVALGCDMRVSSSSAEMGMVETKLAVIPGGGGTQRVPRIVGPGKAKELIFTARIIDGKEAFRIGLVNHNVEQNEEGNAAFQRALSLGEEIAQKVPSVLRLAKQAINRGIEVDMNSGLGFEVSYHAQTLGTKNRLEAAMAFKEKRQPKFKAE